MSLQRWFYTGGHPNRVARLADRFTAALSARGVGPDYLVTLEVPGRRSGRSVSLPLVVADVRGERYLASMLGEGVNWVRNVRAAGGDATLRRGHREEVRLEEVAPERHARPEGLPGAGAECQGPHPRGQERAAGRLRVGGGPVPRVPDRAEDHGVNSRCTVGDVRRAGVASRTPALPPARPLSRAGVLGGVTAGAAVLSCGV